MTRYRLTFKSGGASGVAFYDALSLDDALTAAALEHDPFELLEARAEGRALSLTEQRDGLVKAMRPLLSVLIAMLTNPALAPLFTAERRAQLAGFCADAQEAMLNAGVTKRAGGVQGATARRTPVTSASDASPGTHAATAPPEFLWA